MKYLDRLEFLPGAATQTSILKEPVMSVSDKPAMPLLKESIPLFTCLFKTRKALQRHINSPLLHERLLYIEHWYKRGAKPNTLRRIAAALLNIMEYLQFYSLRPVTVSELKQAANQWAVRKNIRCNGECSPNACRIFISDATRWFSMLNILEKQDIVQSVFQKQMEQFLDFLIKEKGYSENTRYSYSFILKDFLTGIGKDCDNLMQITPLSIDNIFMEKYTKSSYARVTIRTHGAVIRSFLSYAEEKGWCMEGIAATIKAPRIYTQENIPQSPPWNVIRQILNDCKTHIPSDIRDYAILFLLAVYGLRSSEISRLRLKDIDWKEGLVYLRRAKRSRPQVFPLVQSAGNAILRYLTEVRPENIKSEFVFLRMKAPYTPLSTCAVYMIVNKRLRPFNLSIKHKGPHSLRHGCATHLINEGFSLKEISDHLGHKHIETTRIYAKVDLSKLYLVSDMNWEEVL